MHVSLKDVFGTVAFCAVVAWCASLAGADNVIFWIAVGASAILSVLFVRAAKSESGRRCSFLVPMPLLACCLIPFASISLFVNGLLLVVVGVICAARPPMPARRLWVMTLFCAAASLILGALPSLEEIRKLKALRQEFPITSLANRLQYEKVHGPDAGASIATLSNQVASRLVEFEEALDWDGYREHQFRQIHSREYERFVRASGFGVGRMIRPRPESLRRPPLVDIPFDAEYDAQAYADVDGWRAAVHAGKSSDVKHLHAVSQLDFLDAEGFGAVIEPRNQVVGFVEHAFHHPPAAGMEDRELWTIERLALVSLLRFDEPRVYVLGHLPRMDQLASEDVPTRPLDPFESESLKRLWTEADLVISDDGSQIRMLGSLRAASQCLDCHNAERGELLGAFSYVLRVAVVGTSNTE
jgi:hypothetical protein